MIPDQQRKLLLRLARDTLSAHLASQPLPSVPEELALATDSGGAFITLRNKGHLRGCVGCFRPQNEFNELLLGEIIRRVAVAAISDPRFIKSPVRIAEVAELLIEISLLSAIWRTRDPLLLEPGVHGVLIRRGDRSGCFLPHVAAEVGWDGRALLEHCCLDKAGLPRDSWQDPETEVYLFTAERFGEAE